MPITEVEIVLPVSIGETDSYTVFDATGRLLLHTYKKGTAAALVRMLNEERLTPNLIRHYKQAAHETGDLFCWCVQNLKDFPPIKGDWIEEIKLRLKSAAINATGEKS